MISFLKGTVEAKTLTCVYLDVNGVGFEVGMSQTSLSKLPEIGQVAQIFTYMQVRDDGMPRKRRCSRNSSAFPV